MYRGAGAPTWLLLPAASERRNRCSGGETRGGCEPDILADRAADADRRISADPVRRSAAIITHDTNASRLLAHTLAIPPTFRELLAPKRAETIYTLIGPASRLRPSDGSLTTASRPLSRSSRAQTSVAALRTPG
ncbi:hypothetical protein KM043_000843 [Ampulex compressa]|nr:hypothetical protein KM043_000843 [Ampulex compressa]